MGVPFRPVSGRSVEGDDDEVEKGTVWKGEETNVSERRVNWRMPNPGAASDALGPHSPSLQCPRGSRFESL